jgi:hypothetical protein
MSNHTQQSSSTSTPFPQLNPTTHTASTANRPPTVRFKTDLALPSMTSSTSPSDPTPTTPLLPANATRHRRTYSLLSQPQNQPQHQILNQPPTQSSSSRPKTAITPARTSKTSQKLVLLPEQADKVGNGAAATREEELEPQSPLVMRPSLDTWGRTDAERMSKEARQSKYPRWECLFISFEDANLLH